MCDFVRLLFVHSPSQSPALTRQAAVRLCFRMRISRQTCQLFVVCGRAASVTLFARERWIARQREPPQLRASRGNDSLSFARDFLAGGGQNDLPRHSSIWANIDPKRLGGTLKNYTAGRSGQVFPGFQVAHESHGINARCRHRSTSTTGRCGWSSRPDRRPDRRQDPEVSSCMLFAAGSRSPLCQCSVISPRDFGSPLRR